VLYHKEVIHEVQVPSLWVAALDEVFQVFLRLERGFLIWCLYKTGGAGISRVAHLVFITEMKNARLSGHMIT
jgi:hypothetical protein